MFIFNLFKKKEQQESAKKEIRLLKMIQEADLRRNVAVDVLTEIAQDKLKKADERIEACKILLNIW